MLIDDITIQITAGHGGRGAVAFNKNAMALGPVGGNGGRGGSVYVRGVADLGALEHFRYKKTFEAENGAPGRGQFVDGKDGQDLILPVPVGTVIHNRSTGTDIDITKIGQIELVAAGGNGGKGNFKFRSATDTSPRRFQPGLPGEQFELRLELKLIADIGFVGLPNIGKSTLLNLLTNASAKTANYPFTTLEPNLGVYYDLVLADIPGLIEGAAAGKGLGHKFLRHVERTTTLFHFLAADSADIVTDYTTIRAELGAYNPLLLKKPEYLVVSRTDTVTAERLKKIITAAKKLNPRVVAISALDETTLEPLKKVLTKLMREKTVDKKKD